MPDFKIMMNVNKVLLIKEKDLEEKSMGDILVDV